MESESESESRLEPELSLGLESESESESEEEEAAAAARRRAAGRAAAALESCLVRFFEVGSKESRKETLLEFARKYCSSSTEGTNSVSCWGLGRRRVLSDFEEAPV